MRLGLGTKFTLAVLAILTATMAANTLYWLGTSTRFHESQLLERGRALGRLISLISPEAILSFDFMVLNDYTREVASRPDVVYGVIVNPQGAALSSHVTATDPKLKQRVEAAEPAELPKLLRELGVDQGWIHLEFPIAHDSQSLGTFQVGLSRDSLENEFQRQVAIQIGVLIATVVFLCAAIHGVFRANVLYPIRKLIAASRGIGRGEFNPVEVTSDDELGLLARAFNAMAEEVRQEQAKLHRQARFDALTGLPNRATALDRISQEVLRARRHGLRFALLFIDLDDFKSVNDSLGHAVGDQLLVAISTRVQACLRASDTVARLGGDEFVVLTPDISGEAEVEHITERLLAAVVEPQFLGGRKVVARCSIGIAVFPDNGESVEALMANADNAMYQAKATLKGSAIFFTEEMNTRLRARMQLEQDLHQALAMNQFALNFQPIVDAATRRARGAEVLLRWHHPERGFVSPADFIPLAEGTGLIVAIGDWVLEQACRCWAEWTARGLEPGFLAINISRVQFRRRISRRLSELMEQYGVPSHALELEITESVLLDDHTHVAEELANLRAIGLKLSLDDFGTGYSSLSYLKRFPFDVLKIDRSFVAGLPGDPDDVSLVKAILAMAKGLDLDVVAEGVENEEQLRFIAAQGCDLAQGYFFAKPMNEERYREYLQHPKPAVTPLRLTAVGA